MASGLTKAASPIHRPPDGTISRPLPVGDENLVVVASFDPRECLKRRQRAAMRWTDEAKAYKGRRKRFAEVLPGRCGGSTARRR
jgi:hypothetical protein